MSETAPGRPFDGWAELRFAIAELHQLASRLTVHLDADSEHEAIVWDLASWRAADLLERTLADVGTLSSQYLRCAILDRRGIDPLSLAWGQSAAIPAYLRLILDHPALRYVHLIGANRR